MITAVEYYSTAGEIGPHYDSLQRQHSGELPYVFNPEELESEDEFRDPNGKVRNEFGNNYSFDGSPYKIRHDMEVGSLQAPESSQLRNFGMKKWTMVSSAQGDVIIDFVQPCEGPAGCKVIITCRAEVAAFSTSTDVETGRMTENLKDVHFDVHIYFSLLLAL